MSARVLAFSPAEVRMLGAGAGMLRPPAYSRRYTTRLALIDVVVTPDMLTSPHRCPSLRRPRPSRRRPRVL